MPQIPFRFEDSPLLWTVDEVLSIDECKGLIQAGLARGAMVAGGNSTYRDQDRIAFDDTDLAASLFGRLRHHLPATMGPLHLLGLNSRFRFYRYQPGQRFAVHTDHWFQPQPTVITLLTVLVYLNDDFAGGSTQFRHQVDHVVVPKTGRVALWQHKLDHEGLEVERRTKFALRTDVYYASDAEPITVEGGVPQRPAARAIVAPDRP